MKRFKVVLVRTTIIEDEILAVNEKAARDYIKQYEQDFFVSGNIASDLLKIRKIEESR